jgi:hypothetical protein
MARVAQANSIAVVEQKRLRPALRPQFFQLCCNDVDGAIPANSFKAPVLPPLRVKEPVRMILRLKEERPLGTELLDQMVLPVAHLSNATVFHVDIYPTTDRAGLANGLNDLFAHQSILLSHLPSRETTMAEGQLFPTTLAWRIQENPDHPCPKNLPCLQKSPQFLALTIKIRADIKLV